MKGNPIPKKPSNVEYLVNPVDNVRIPYIKSITNSKELFLLVPGFGAAMSLPSPVVELESRLSHDGLSWCIFDLRGQGESEAPFSFDGSISDMLFLGSYMRKVTGKSLVVVGHSLGGTIACFSSTTKTTQESIKEYVKATCILSAPNDMTKANSLGMMIRFADWILNDIQVIANLNILKKITVNYMGVKFNLEVFQQFLKEAFVVKAVDGVKDITCPITLFHGTIDTTVPPSDLKDLYEAANSPKLGYYVSGTDHVYIGKIDLVYKLIIDGVYKKHDSDLFTTV